jgi:hypothetical protein
MPVGRSRACAFRRLFSSAAQSRQPALSLACGAEKAVVLFWPKAKRSRAAHGKRPQAQERAAVEDLNALSLFSVASLRVSNVWDSQLELASPVVLEKV